MRQVCSLRPIRPPRQHAAAPQVTPQVRMALTSLLFGMLVRPSGAGCDVSARCMRAGAPILPSPSSSTSPRCRQFGAGWWVFIDGYAWCIPSDKGGSAQCAQAKATQGYAWIPLFGATVSFVMMNGMK
jgi:hypothetical protein